MGESAVEEEAMNTVRGSFKATRIPDTRPSFWETIQPFLPKNKVIAQFGTTAIVFLAQRYLQVEPSVEVQTTISVILGAIVAYWVPDRDPLPEPAPVVPLEGLSSQELAVLKRVIHTAPEFQPVGGYSTSANWNQTPTEAAADAAVNVRG